MRRPRQWVSKTDVMNYHRCPYAFWLQDCGEVRLDAEAGPIIAELLDEGVAFEERIVAGAPHVSVTHDEFTSLLGDDVTLYRLPHLRNQELRIHGKLDVIETKHGQLIPGEIKLHWRPKLNDKLELAFYWLLLEPFRTVETEPRGVVLVPVDDGFARHELELNSFQLGMARRLIKDVRVARRDGVKPTYHTCEICLSRPEVQQTLVEKNSLTILSGIKARTAEVLASVGISNLDELLACDPEETARLLAGQGLKRGAATIRRWQGHAQSYRQNAPILNEGDGITWSDCLVVDFEYESYRKGDVWLIGIGVLKDDDLEIQQFWAEDVDEAALNLRTMMQLVGANPDLPIVTWAGKSAELPQLRRAAERTGEATLFEEFFKRQIDLRAYTQSRVTLPIPSRDLKTVSSHLGFRWPSDIHGGREAGFLRRKYLRSEDAALRAVLKADLLRYNRADIEALAFIARKYRELKW